MHSFKFQSNPDGIKWLGRSLRKKVLKNGKVKMRNIFIDRRKIYRRQVDNFEEILPILEKYDFELVNPSDYSVNDQIKIFAGANVIAGPTGAAFANMIFAENPSIIYSWHINDKVNCWQNLSFDLGYKYFPVKTKEIPDKNESYTNLDLIIDKNDLENSILKSLGK